MEQNLRWTMYLHYRKWEKYTYPSQHRVHTHKLIHSFIPYYVYFILPVSTTNMSPRRRQSMQTLKHTTEYQYRTYPSFIDDCLLATFKNGTPNFRLEPRRQCQWLSANAKACLIQWLFLQFLLCYQKSDFRRRRSKEWMNEWMNEFVFAPSYRDLSRRCCILHVHHNMLANSTQLNSTGDYGRRCLTPLCPHH